MDISKLQKKRNEWIFDETFKTDVYGTFIKAEDYKTNSDKDAIVFKLEIEDKEYMIMPFKVDYVEFVDLYDNETDKWCGKKFLLTHNKKNKYMLKPIEENI